MATKKRKKAVAAPTVVKAKKPTLMERYTILKATISKYFELVRYRRPDQHQIILSATVTTPEGIKRDGVINIPSLLAAVLTAQGLGKEVRLEGVQDGQGGILYVRFYSPIRMPDGADLLV
jgi:hypothetical protein